MNRLFIIFLLAIGIFACTPKIQEANPADFEKANSIKAETEGIQLDIKEALQNLTSERNGIMVQGRELTDAELKFTEKVDEILAIESQLQAFQKDIATSEGAYEPNGKELLYLNEQANKLVKRIQKKIQKLNKTKE